MKNTTKWLLACIALASMAYGCSDDSSGGAVPSVPIPQMGDDCTSSSECPEDAVCKDGKCAPKEDDTCKDGSCVTPPEKKCGDKTCSDNQVCKNDECIDKCGDDVCEDGEKCENGECVEIETGTPCGSELCTADQSCLNGKCHDAGDCGGLSCLEDEVCDSDTCIVDDCNGTKCAPGEICDKDAGFCRAPGDCGGMQCTENEYCFNNESCQSKEKCGDIYCDVNYVCDNGDCVLGDTCVETGEAFCGTQCCSIDEFCGSRKNCCSHDNTCGSDCCQAGETCVNEVCHIACGDGIERCASENGNEICCEPGQICTSHQCFAPTTSCVDNYMCENGQYCDMESHQCLPQPTGEVCQSKPTGGEVTPTLVWYWGDGDLKPAADDHPDHVQVMSSPMVADMNNDTIPDVVFNAFSGSGYNGNGILRILNGKTGQQIASSDGNPFTDGGSQVALGDIDGDTIPEIVTCSAEYKLIVYDFDPTNNKLSVKWKSTNSITECGQGGPGIADFNGDGQPEVYVRYNVHDGKTGELIGSELCVDANHNNSIQHARCDYAVAADLNGDGIQELVGGNVAWTVDFENKKLVPFYDRRSDQTDGYPAIADLDGDGKPEIFVVQADVSTTMVFKNDGTNFWEAAKSHSEVGAGGPPTIANLNTTKQPELTFAGRYAYIAYDYLGNELWRRTTHDYSSAKTGSSVFDFDGDGKADVVYADEFFLRVYNGENGKTVYCQCNTSGTHWEYPVIVDVNNDGHAEIVISSNNSMTGACPTSLTESEGWDECVDKIMKSSDENDRAGTHGVRVFSSPNHDWINTRKIYNQHAYSVTNVSDDGTIPTKVRSNWTTQGLNNFRLNVQPGATYLPNLTISDISSPFNCNPPIPIYFNINNIGWATAPAGITVHVWAASTENGEYKEVGTITTDKPIRPGDSYAAKFNHEEANLHYIWFKFDENAPEQCSTDEKDQRYEITCPIF